MEVFGYLATVTSLLISCVGLPAQAWKNYRIKDAKSLSPALVCSTFAAYLSWTLYGWTKPDVFLKVSQTPGLIFSGILLCQLIHYRLKR